MLTMLLGGLWHGAAWTFVVWGAIHGVAQSVEHWRRTGASAAGLPEPPDTARRRWAQRIVTFNVVCLAWIFFRAESLDTAFDYLTPDAEPGRTGSGGVAAGDASACCSRSSSASAASSCPRGVHRPGSWPASRGCPRSAMGVVLGVALMVINTLGPRGVAPFIYFQF